MARSLSIVSRARRRKVRGLYFPAAFITGMLLLFLPGSGWVHAQDGDSGDSPVAEGDGEADEAEDPFGNGLPFPLVKPLPKDIRHFQALALNAVTAARDGNPEKAMTIWRGLEPTEKLAQVIRALQFAEAALLTGRPREADSAAAACLSWVGSRTWRAHLMRLRIRAWPSLQLPAHQLRAQWEEALRLPLHAEEKRALQISLLSLDTVWSPERESGFRRYLGWAVRGSELDSVGQEVARRFPPGKGTWEQQWLALDFEDKRGRLSDALARCLAMRDMEPSKKEKQKLHKEYASLHYRMGSYEEAIQLYRLFLDRYGDDSQAFLQIARAYDRLGNTGQSLLWYDRFIDRYPRHSKTSEVYWLRGWEAEAAGKYDEAVEHYSRQLVQFPGTSRADWARFRMGLCRFKAASPEAALADFQAIRGQKPSGATPAGLYWEAKLLDSLGAVSAADSVRRELCSVYPFNFYGHLARQILQAGGRWPDSLDLGNRLPSSQPEAIKRWMGETLSRFRDDLANPYESEYLPVTKLLQWKLDTLALWTLRTTPAKITNNPWFLFVHARRLHEAGLHREGYRYGLRLSYQFPEGSWGRVPRSVLKTVYPEPYIGLFQKEAAAKGLDPYLVLALARQESAFDARIRSSAGAVGLMQMMPATGRMQAGREGLKEFRTEMLEDPEVNVHLGTAYLRDVLAKHDGKLHFTLAHYNAGPTPTARWERLLGGKPLDEIVDDISYYETRGYVKKVMGNYWSYQLLYGP